jgi:hypothetical protein
MVNNTRNFWVSGLYNTGRWIKSRNPEIPCKYKYMSGLVIVIKRFLELNVATIADY